MLEGQAWIIPPDGEAVAIGPGDVAVLRGPASYIVADDPAVPPWHVISSPPTARRRRARSRMANRAVDPRSCGIAESRSAALLTGAYQGRAGISDRRTHTCTRLHVSGTAVAVRAADTCQPATHTIRHPCRHARTRDVSPRGLTALATPSRERSRPSPHVVSQPRSCRPPARPAADPAMRQASSHHRISARPGNA
ncbi:cupin domain-containing protein [Nonomuraea insulae]|uniref:Cupin domain-containing protein n=1 Tax=Nonomuraea insulae TaxID=1616787 RepID=A0ABW1CYF6_9ACTN